MNFEQLKEFLHPYDSTEILVVGLGNKYCSDDGAGLLLFEKLRKKKELRNADFLQVGCNPENYLMQIIEKKPKLIMFLDAAEERESRDTIKIYQSDEIEDKDFSTHAYSLGFIEKFIKRHIKAEFIYLGINIKNSLPGIKISQKITKIIESFVEK